MITGKEIHNLARRLWRINRSITGDGNRLTLDILKEICPEMKIYEVPSGTKVFDWTVPNEWNVKEAWIKDPSGNKIVDFEECNLHLVGYSIPVHKTINLKQLQNHLHSRPDLPSAIPYVTSYYNHYWGFCLSDLQRRSLCKGEYEVYVDSELKNGSLTYGEILLEGESKQEIFLSTYICHPSMANNELSGMTVTAYIAKWLASLKQRQYSYRIIFIPETIGSLTYLNKNLKKMKDNIIAGFNVSCVGDDRMYS